MKEELSWTETTFYFILAMIVGYLVVFVFTIFDARQSRSYQIKIAIFFIYELIVLVLFTFHFLNGFYIAYGPHFAVKVITKDPKTNKIKYLINDGTYIIKDGIVTGRITFAEANQREEELFNHYLEP